VPFGDTQWGTNFATQPGFIPFPLPTIIGEAALCSTVDVFSDNANQLSKGLPAGPFTIVNLPVATGAGAVALVLRDLLGREQVVTQPYYVVSVAWLGLAALFLRTRIRAPGFWYQEQRLRPFIRHGHASRRHHR
jgi:outer membrane usher protein FimD/PapC